MSAEVGGAEDDQRRPERAGACASGAPACDSSEPRAALVATLAASLAELMAAGDLGGARVVNEAISKLLAPEASGQAGEVIPLRRAR